MKYFTCCCEWSYVIAKKRVYGPIYPMGIGTYPTALSTTQRMMLRARFEDEYVDCFACYSGGHHHKADR